MLKKIGRAVQVYLWFLSTGPERQKRRSELEEARGIMEQAYLAAFKRIVREVKRVG